MLKLVSQKRRKTFAPGKNSARPFEDISVNLIKLIGLVFLYTQHKETYHSGIVTMHCQVGVKMMTLKIYFRIERRHLIYIRTAVGTAIMNECYITKLRQRHRGIKIGNHNM